MSDLIERFKKKYGDLDLENQDMGSGHNILDECYVIFCHHSYSYALPRRAVIIGIEAYKCIDAEDFKIKSEYSYYLRVLLYDENDDPYELENESEPKFTTIHDDEIYGSYEEAFSKCVEFNEEVREYYEKFLEEEKQKYVHRNSQDYENAMSFQRYQEYLQKLDKEDMFFKM